MQFNTDYNPNNPQQYNPNVLYNPNSNINNAYYPNVQTNIPQTQPNQFNQPPTYNTTYIPPNEYPQPNQFPGYPNQTSQPQNQPTTNFQYTPVNNNPTSNPYNPNATSTYELKGKIELIEKGANAVKEDITIMKIKNFFDKMTEFFNEPTSWMPQVVGKIYAHLLAASLSKSSNQDGKKNNGNTMKLIALGVFILSAVVFGSMKGDFEGLRNLEDWKQHFFVNKKFPDEGVKLDNFIGDNQTKLQEALEGPRRAYEAARQDIMKRIICKTIAISGLVFSAIGFWMVAEGVAAFGLVIAAGGGLAWLFNKVVNPNYMQIMERKMNELLNSKIPAAREVLNPKYSY